MKRRGFLGALGGAAVAGPSVAKNALAQLPTGLGHTAPGIPPSGYLNAVDKSSISGDWELNQIERLRRLLSGEKTDEEREAEAIERRENRNNIMGQEIACLRSVSGTAKLEMYSRRMQAIREQRQQYYWSRELADYLKRGFK